MQVEPEMLRVRHNSSPELNTLCSEKMRPTIIANVASSKGNEPTLIVIHHEPGALGIHVVPSFDAVHHREDGLVIESIEPDGRIDRDGRLSVGDRIVEINGQPLFLVHFANAQEVFRDALKLPEIVLKVFKNRSESSPSSYSSSSPLVSPLQQIEVVNKAATRRSPPPVMPKPSRELVEQVEDEEGLVEGETREQTSRVATAAVTSTKKLTAALSSLHSMNETAACIGGVSTPSSVSAAASPIVTSNTRKIGRRYHIRLTKMREGLGFSITTRDNPAGGNCPIYIKNIMSKGSAIHDGRLKQGDRLLEVNGVVMTGKSQNEAAAFLKNIAVGKQVDLIISRQECQSQQPAIDASPSPKLPRQLPPENGEIQTGRQREVLTFEIPLNDTGSAGLGVSVKGKTTTTTEGLSIDLGIFVKSVIHGGAASKDGRLNPNDQLISINGQSLLGLSNSTAMAMLRQCMMHCEGPIAKPGVILMTIARRVPATQAPNDKREEEENYAHHHKRDDSILSTVSADSGEEQFLTPPYSVLHSTPTRHEDSSRGSLISNENTTVIYNGSRVPTVYAQTTADSLNLSASVGSRHPVIDRLTGNQSLPESQQRGPTYSKQTTAVEEEETTEPIYSSKQRERNVSVSPHRADVLIEHDRCAEATLWPASEEENCEINIKNGDSEMSLNKEDDPGFQRDGFGRQSMSEKRHAHLDAKNTDTYQRNKKSKDDQRHRTSGRFEKGSPERVSAHQSGGQRAVETRAATTTTQQQLQQPELHDLESSSNSKTVSRVKEARPFFLTPACCWSCQSPGSCPYHAAPPQRKPNRLRKASSLENLQTMMQDLQRDQLEGKGGNPFSGPRPATLKVSRSRATNESFRVAVDRSFEPTSTNYNPIETVKEEGEIWPPHYQRQQSAMRQSFGHHQPSATTFSVASESTQFTEGSSQPTTQTNDSQSDLIKEKKKNTIFGKLFKLGSKKRKTFPKSPERQATEFVSEDREKEAEMIRARRAAQIEQQKINEHYIRHKEMQQQRDEAKEDKYSHYMNYQEIINLRNQEEQLRMHAVRNSVRPPPVQYLPVYHNRQPPPPIPANQMINPNWQVMREDRVPQQQQRPVRRHGYVVDPQVQDGYISPSNMMMNGVHRSSGIYKTYVAPVSQPTYIQHQHMQQNGHGYYHDGPTYGHIGHQNGIYGTTTYAGHPGQALIVHAPQNGFDRRRQTYHFPVNQQPLM